MFDQNSRYASLATASRSVTGADGVLREIRYVTRRFLPQPSSFTTLVEVGVKLGDRLDTITADNLGDPTRFWTVSDANNAMNPFDLVAEPGAILDIPAPQFQSIL